MNATQQRQRLRGVLAGDACIRPASVFDPISARIAIALGFEVGMFAGSVASAVVLGAPDIVVLTLTEFAQQARRITRASDLSLVVDADHGYGNALNVMRTVEELEVAGVSALTLEDTVLPRPFRQKKDQGLLPVEVMTANLKAALEAREDPSLMIVGRTAAMAFAGVEAAVQRVKAYSEVGVDAIFLTGVTTREQVETVSQATDLPLLLGSTPSSINDLDYLGANGVRIALAGHLPFMASVKAVYDTLKHLREGGSPEDLTGVTATEDMMAVVTDMERYSSWQKEYLE